MNNFKLIKTEKIDKESSIFIYNHKSGLEIVFFKNSDKNRVFLPCFKTLAENNKGTAHIVEHCLLCGSKKYPIKDPFNELAKGTLNTYLNAITYRDKTIYPIGSTELSEFKKMFKVYIDGVFAPLLKEEVFLLEGIRKDIKEKKFNGIVYNEMISAYNDNELRLMETVIRELFPDNAYKFNNAGEPSEIEKLTYKEFLDYYNNYYSKSNCILYFYGDIEIDEYLDYIEKNYMKDCQPNDKIVFQKQQPVVSSISKYDDMLGEFNYYSIAYVVNDSRELYAGYEFNILIDYLLSDESSPLYKYLIEKYDFEDITYDIESQFFQNVFTIMVKSKNIENVNEIKESINSFLKKHINDGFCYEKIDGQVNNFKFSVMEEDYGYKPKGLGYFLHIIEFWLYSDIRKTGMLPCQLDFNKIKNDIKNGKLEKILTDEILLSKHYCTVELLSCPQKHKEEKKIKINQIDIEKSNLLDEFLKLDDSKLANKLIETMPLKNIQKKEYNDVEIISVDNKKVFYVESKKNDISYYTVHIQVGNLDFNVLGLYIELFAQLSTKNFLIEKLNVEIDKYIGDFQISFDSFVKDDNINYYVILEVKVLNEFLKNSLELVFEILNNTIYTELKLIKRKIKESYSDLEETLDNDNWEMGVNRCFSNFSYENKVVDDVEGVGFFYFLNEIKNYDYNNLKVIIKKLEDVKKTILGESNIFFSVYTSNINEFLSILKDIKIKNNKLITKNVKEMEIYLKKDKKESIKIRGNNNTNIMCGQLKNLKYTAKWNVLANIIRNDFLNKEIRIKGGAYGYGFEILRNNKFYVYSTNDPNSLTTFKVFERIADYINNIIISEEDLNKYIVGTIGEFYDVKTDYDLFSQTIEKLLRGINKNDDEEKIKEIVQLTSEDIKKISYEIFSNVENSRILRIGR